MRLPLLVRLWFAADLALALLPPLHWTMGSGQRIFGIPLVLVYLIGSSTFIALSVVVAYFSERPAN